ncbi:cephalosporin hydroxylase family protein [Cohnella suwonensis]|uniref:Cephalosporin hydroxylase family protein n=1 Tax=Cohnella suwonensis TaxID=696072 RepID=A0ABW0LVH6_9BACL
MNPIELFRKEVSSNIANMSNRKELKDISNRWIESTTPFKYTYNFSWMGRPIIQFPQDIIAMQEIIWDIKPDLIVETGVAHGGSIIFYASMLELIGHGNVIGIDIDIREHNRIEIEKHPMFKRIQLIEGSSTDETLFHEITESAMGAGKVLVVLDSNHTHDHVLRELELYSTLVNSGSYLVVMDTVVDDMPSELHKERPWNRNSNPKTAVQSFLRSNDRFVIDETIHNKLLITVAPDGYLKCTKDL